LNGKREHSGIGTIAAAISGNKSQIRPSRKQPKEEGIEQDVKLSQGKELKKGSDEHQKHASTKESLGARRRGKVVGISGIRSAEIRQRLKKNALVVILYRFKGIASGREKKRAVTSNRRYAEK